MSLPQGYFDGLYRTDPDPWRFRTRPYEARKRALTLAALPDDRYGTAFEPGCSIGILTAALAGRCSRVCAMDISPLALATASRTVPANVELRRGGVPDDWPAEAFDLVVLSEVGYYLDAAGFVRLAELAVGGARDLLAVHWRHPVDDYPLGGDEVHDLLAAAAGPAGMARLVSHREDDLCLDVWSHDHRSVAVRTALVDR
jgi:hypothetical protein